MTEAELQKILKDRETIPIYDESIFEPEKRLYELGFTDEDIEDLRKYFRWLLEQREKQSRRPEELIESRFRLLQLLGNQHRTIAIQRRAELLAELDLLEQGEF